MKKILLAQFLLLLSLCAFAQVSSPSKSQIQNMKVEDLTDDQIRQLVEEMKRNNIAIDQIDIYAQQKGIQPSEVAKLKSRIQQLNIDKELSIPRTDGDNGNERMIDNDGKEKNNARTPEEISAENRRMKIFGAELFSNKNLTFEPNLRMPTPPNYRLATGDELVIDIYGYSEVQHKLKVSPEGYVRIPYLGPVYVNGLTIEDAKARITKQLGTIYGGIKAGNTFVQISLGNIRSIRVLLIGEIMHPGSYTLPSLASVANALYLSGGPNQNGSFRDIQVIRNGQPITSFDLYDFLINGDLTNNIILQDQDIVKVNPYKLRVELVGEVKRPAIFEVKETETLQDVLNFAGGYTDISFRDIIRASRVNNKEREVVNIPSSEIATFRLHSGDKFYIDSILNRFSNRVTITGAVFHPGDYALEENMTLIDLIRKADGVKEIASLSRGIIRRLKDDFSPTILNFNLEDVISGKSTIRLQREDSIVIYSKNQLKEEFFVKISGEVNNAGYFKYADSLHLEDLIVMAGGLKDAASLKKVEISRRIRDPKGGFSDADVAQVLQVDIAADLSSNADAAAFILQPFDEVIVRKSPSYVEQASVSIDGEVTYPGTYTIKSKRERISDLIKRAGGLKPEAYLEGAVLLRKTFVNASDSLLLNNKLEVFYNKIQDSSDIAKLQAAIDRKEQLLGIDLVKILQNPGSKNDLLLEEGDVIKIPKKLQTVQLFGEIYFPKKVRFDKSSTFRDYIRRAGGFTNNALKRRSYVVYANGEVKSSRKVLFFNSYPKVEPGTEIYIPAKAERRGLTTQEAMGITTGIASLALIIVTILDRVK